MQTNRSVATLRIVGGNPSLDFANTVSGRLGRMGPDLLCSYADLLDWCERVAVLDAVTAARLRGVAAASPVRATRALAEAKQLREAIYRVFSMLAAGQPAPASDLALLERRARAAAAARDLAREGAGYAWVWRDDGLDAVSRRLALAAADLLTGGGVGRVKECFGRNCGWLFLDTSRNGLRRWCSDEDCGTPARVARHRAKLRGAGEEVG